MNLILPILAVICYLQCLDAFNSGSRRPKLVQRKSYDRPSRILQPNEEYKKMYSDSDEDISDNVEHSGGRFDHFGSVRYFNVRPQDLNEDEDNSLCEAHKSRPRDFKMKQKPKPMRYRPKDHGRQKIFIYASLPKAKCECNQTKPQNPAEPTSTTVHPFYDRYAGIPELTKRNQTNAAKISKNKNSNASEGQRPQTKPTKPQTSDQENENLTENPSESKKNNQSKKDNNSITSDSKNMDGEDNMEVDETINYEQVQAPRTSYVKQQKREQMKPVYLKNYPTIVPITAESNVFESKQKRDQPYLNDMPLDEKQPTNHYQIDAYKNYEESPTKYSKPKNRKLLDKYANYRPRQSNGGRNFFKRHYTNNDDPLRQSREDYAEIPLSDEGQQYIQLLKSLWKSHQNYISNKDKDMPDSSIQSVESFQNQPQSIYLNKIITKRCNGDHDQFPILQSGLDSNPEDEVGNVVGQAKLDDTNSKKSDNSDLNEDLNKSEVEVKDDYINSQVSRDNGPIVCNNWSNNGDAIEGDPSKCAVRPAFRDLYGYQQHLTK